MPRESIALTAAISRGEPPYLQIARHYREQIEQGKLQSGASLPSVREMAEIWGVAHTTAARTLKALQDQGLVVSTPGFGTVVVAGEQGAERLAHRFHDLYEELAPSFGYETREASRKPWADVPEQNKQLMIAVAQRLLSEWPR